MLELRDIEAASQRIKPYINHTPILQSTLLNQWLGGHEVFFKCENFQKIGAFKARGGINTVSWLIENKKKPTCIVANSSGNHAQAVALAGKTFGIKTKIFMPKYASAVKIQATKFYGAEVILSDTRDQSDILVQQAAEEKGTFWIPPFNHEQVICGQGTVALEVFCKQHDFDAVFTPCGGGGLCSGTLIATRGLSPKTKVVGIEPLNANDAAQSLAKGSIVKLDKIPDTLADGAMTMAVGNITFEYLKQLDDFIVVPEERIVYWTQWLSHLLKCRVEPTCAMPMDGVIQFLKKQKSKRKVLVIISGGNMDAHTSKKIWDTDRLDEVPSLI